LIQESLTPVAFVDARHCRVLTGTWRDACSGVVYTDPSVLDIDHLVPFANAHFEWRLDNGSEARLSYDSVTFGAVPLVMVATALVACALPAYRASRVESLVALRAE
jgi:hypothetical protein